MTKFFKYILRKPLFTYSALVSYYFLISFFPFVFLLTKLTALFSISSDYVMNAFYHMFPKMTYNILYDSLQSISSTNSLFSYIFYSLFALWSASMLINSIKIVLSDEPMKQTGTKTFLIRRAVSLALTLLLALLIVFSFTLVMYINIIVTLLARYFSINYISSFITLILSVVVGITDFMLIYKFLPNKPIKFTQALPGAIFATTMYGFASWLYSLYIGYIADYSRFYGTFDTIIIFVIWLYILSFILILGGHINLYIINLNKNQAE